ncbi:MAG TPA: glycine cleavage T C-terminal barrel domain-containing protein [Pyrinomonadaceae bacterium]|nr:glycine cleavage T C-terminal barrel domain-containing protein [Pyrinomonadaceae bacterium]
MNETVEELTIQQLTLEDLHRTHGATFAERDGFMLPSGYGDARAEYEAVRGAATTGLIDLSARGRIEVSGAEAVQFLNGLITNDVKTLGARRWMRAAFPNVQGRLLASVRVARPGDEVSFLIDTEPATHRKVFQTLERFTLAGDFRVKDVSAETVQLSLQGGGARDAIKLVCDSSFGQTNEGEAVVVNWRGRHPVTVICDSHMGDTGFDLVCPAGGAAELWEALTESGARPVGFEAFEVLRVEAGVPRYGVDVDETNVVLEAVREAETVSYTKGCYIGQEIIARIHWRGHVAKQLAGLILEDEREPGASAKVRTTDGKEIGRVTSHVFSPRLARRIALAIIKYDYLRPGTQVSVVAGEEERTARVAELPFVGGGRHETAGASGDAEETTP